MFKPTSPENAAIVDKIKSQLSAIPMGGIVNYSRLNSIAKVDLTNGHRYLLTKAIEHSEKELGCIFSCVRGLGIKRVPSQEIPETGLAALGRIRKAARRAKKRINRVNVNSLSDGEQRRVVGYSAMLGAIEMVADGRRAGAIAAVADPAKPIPPQNILDMFRN